MGISNAPDPSAQPFPLETIEHAVAHSVAPLVTSALSNDAGSEACLDCGAPARADSFFCEACGTTRENSAKQYERDFVDRLGEARALKESYRFEEAVDVLRALAETDLRQADAEKVQRRIKRVYEWRDYEAEQMQAKVNRARRWIEQDSYEQAIRLLDKVVDPFRDAEAERLARLANEKEEEVGSLYQRIKKAVKKRQWETGLSAADRLLEMAPNHRRTPAVVKLRRKCHVELVRAQPRKRDQEAKATPERARARAGNTDEGTRAKTKHSDQARGRQPRRATLASGRGGEPPLPSSGQKHDNCYVGEESQREEPRRRDWLEQLRRFNRRCLSSGWMPWLLAVYGHALLILLLYCLTAAAAEPMTEGPMELYLTAGFIEPEQTASVVIEQPPSIEEPTAEEPQVEVPLPPAGLPEEATEEIPAVAEEVEPETVLEPVEEVEEPEEEVEEEEPVEPSPPEEVVEAEEATTEAAEPVEAPSAEHAVKSGNFVVWSVPTVPVAGEPYSVYVRIRLPDRVTRYRRSDLSGVLIGSDGYQKSIGSPHHEFLPLVDHTATIVIPVVGATRPEADILILRSRLLKQQKTIRLIYDRA